MVKGKDGADYEIISADNAGYMASYIVPLICMAYMLFYAVAGCKNVNKDIPVE